MFNVPLHSHSAIEAHRSCWRVENNQCRKQALYQRYSRPIRMARSANGIRGNEQTKEKDWRAIYIINHNH